MNIDIIMNVIFIGFGATFFIDLRIYGRSL
jgi:hypothetical protein